MLNEFTASRRDVAVVRSSVQEVWSLLVQPEVLVRNTPFVHAIDDEGDGCWVWRVGGIPYPGGVFTTAFTERMAFAEPHHIDFHHEPASDRELAGARGAYDLTPGEDGTTLAIELSVHTRLPVPRAASAVVEKAMDVVIAQMGKAFAQGLLAELGEGS